MRNHFNIDICVCIRRSSTQDIYVSDDQLLWALGLADIIVRRPARTKSLPIPTVITLASLVEKHREKVPR